VFEPHLANWKNKNSQTVAACFRGSGESGYCVWFSCILCPCRLLYLTCIDASVDSKSLHCAIRMCSWMKTRESWDTKTFVRANLGSWVLVEFPIVCMTSTAELRTFFIPWISAIVPLETGRRRTVAVRACVVPDKAWA